jgi:hypothetical protein
MAKVNVLKSNFNGGELTPRLEDRTNLPKVQNGCRRMLNFLVRPHGGAALRPGLRFINAAKYNDRRARLIGFRFSTIQTYMLEFGHQYIRFYKDGGRIVNGDGTPYEIVTTFAEGDLPGLSWVQSADVMYIVHQSHPPRRLTRTGHTSWTITDVVFSDGPWLAQNDTDTTLTASGTSGNITITANSVTGINGDAGFAASDVGRMVRIKKSAGTDADGDGDVDWGWGTITAVNSTTSVAVTVKSNFDGAATSGSKSWRLGAWWQGNYPCAVTFHQGRLWFCGTPNDPARLWGSKSEDYHNFELGDEDDDSIELRLAANDVHAIRWMISNGKTLAVGTDSGEWLIGSGVTDPTITPNALSPSLETVYGSAQNLPVRRLGGSTLFIHRAKRKLMALKYFFESDTYDCEDLTILANHITKGGLIDWAWQEEPDRILWFARGDGFFPGFTFAPQHDVAGWHRHQTDGAVESIGSIPGDGPDEMWCLVNRTVQNETRRYIERMDPSDEDIARDDAFFVDCGLTYDGEPTTKIHGLDHLIGKSVAILADGGVLSQQVVADDGSVTLPYEASKVHVGLPYRGLLEPTGIDAGAMDGSAQGKMKMVLRVAVDVLNSGRGKIGPSEDDLVDMEGGPEQTAFDVPPPLYTGEMLTPFPGSWGPEVEVVIVADDPLPFELRSIAMYINVNDA